MFAEVQSGADARRMGGAGCSDGGRAGAKAQTKRDEEPQPRRRVVRVAGYRTKYSKEIEAVDEIGAALWTTAGWRQARPAYLHHSVGTADLHRAVGVERVWMNAGQAGLARTGRLDAP